MRGTLTKSFKGCARPWRPVGPQSVRTGRPTRLPPRLHRARAQASPSSSTASNAGTDASITSQELQKLESNLDEIRAQDPISAATLDLDPRETAEASGIAVSLFPCPPEPRVPFEETVLLQGFGWDSCKDSKGWWNSLKDRVPDISAAGFTHVWLPPPSQSVDKRGYLPSLLYNLHNAYGTQEQLLALNIAFKEANITPVCDVVVNHRCADKQGKDGKWNVYGDVPNVGRSDRATVAWGPEAIASDDHEFGGKGSRDSGASYEAAPDLDHSNPKVRAGITDWLRYLIEDVGFEAFRFDYVKGFGAEYTKGYVEATLGTEAPFAVGEYWTDLTWHGSHLDYNQDPACNVLCDWINQSGKLTAAFDFPLKGQLNEAFKNCQYDRLRRPDGKAAGLVGWWPNRSLTFVDNHDTGSSQQHWPCPSDAVDQGYAYILTHPGVPVVLYEHWRDWTLHDKHLGTTINELIALRRRVGINARSKVEIRTAEHDFYVAEIFGTKGSLVLKLGPRYHMGSFKPDKAVYDKAIVGHNWCVWVRDAQSSGSESSLESATSVVASVSNSNGQGNA